MVLAQSKRDGGIDRTANNSFGWSTRNAAMEYELECECGRKMTVRETAAGVKEQCPCGRTVVVPSLHELRQRAGFAEPSLSPEKVVETLLLAGRLPEERHCVLCGAATDGVICCTTECERAHIQTGERPWWMYLLSIVTFGWMGAVMVYSTRKEDREWGTDRIFPLPLRICPGCLPKLVGMPTLKAALIQVPVYARLLEKYPNARITVSSSQAAIPNIPAKGTGVVPGTRRDGITDRAANNNFSRGD